MIGIGQGYPGAGHSPVPSTVVDDHFPIAGTEHDLASKNLPADLINAVKQARCRVTRIPKVSRIQAVDKLTSILAEIIAGPDAVSAWNKLLLFSFACLAVPRQRGDKRHKNSVASKLNGDIVAFPQSATHSNRMKSRVANG